MVDLIKKMESQNTIRIRGSDRVDVRYWGCWAAIVLLYIVLRINLIDIPLDRDEGIFGYAGQVILNNGLPYQEVFDHKPPLIFYINAFALLLVPPTSSGIHIFLHIYNFLTLIMLFFLAKIYFKSSSVGFWTALCYAVFSTSPAIQGFTASTEMYMLLPISASLLFAVMAIREQKNIYSSLSGAIGIMACWTKPTAFFPILFVALYLATARTYSFARQRDNKIVSASRLLSFWLAGAAGISVIIAAYFYYRGVIDEFVYWSFSHGTLYAGQADIMTNLAEVFRRVRDILRGDSLIVMTGFLSAVFAILRKDRRGYFLFGFIVLSFIGTLPGYASRHYFAQLAPSVALASGFGFSGVINAITSKGRRLCVISITTLMIIIIPLIVHSGYYLEESPEKISRNVFGHNPFPESIVLGEYLAQHTQPEDTIFIFGSEAQILFYSQRKSATSYAMIYPLMSAYPRYMEFQERAWKEILANSPLYIIIVDLTTSLSWDEKASLWIYDQVRQLVAVNYHLEGEMMIGGEKGRLLLFAAGINRDDFIHADAPKIFLYRRNY